MSIYKENDYNREKADKQGKKIVFNYMKQYGKNPQKAYKFFGKKVITTWADPLYESIFSGPKAAQGQYTKTKLLLWLFNEEKYDTFIYYGMKAYIILLLGGVWIFLIRYLKKYDKITLGLIFLIGGFLFHLFWETKSQYVYPYIFMQIPAAAYVITRFCEKILEKGK